MRSFARVLLLLAATLNAALCAVRSEAIYFDVHDVHAAAIDIQPHSHDLPHSHTHSHSHPHSHPHEADDHAHHDADDLADPSGHEHPPATPSHFHIGHWYDHVVALKAPVSFPPSSVPAVLPTTLASLRFARVVRPLAPATLRCLGPPPATRTSPLLI